MIHLCYLTFLNNNLLFIALLQKVLLQYKTDFKNAAAKIQAKHKAKDLKSVVKLMTKDKIISKL